MVNNLCAASGRRFSDIASHMPVAAWARSENAPVTTVESPTRKLAETTHESSDTPAVCRRLDPHARQIRERARAHTVVGVLPMALRVMSRPRSKEIGESVSSPVSPSRPVPPAWGWPSQRTSAHRRLRRRTAPATTARGGCSHGRRKSAHRTRPYHRLHPGIHRVSPRRGHLMK
jgi:hypothetical protein